MGHGVYEYVLVGGVSAVTYCSEAVERGDAESGGEIAVGATACRGFTYLQAHLRGESFCAGEKRGAVFAFQWRAIEAAGDFEFGAAVNGFKGLKAFFEGVHVGSAPGAKIENGFGVFGDDVGTCAAPHHIGVDGDSTAKIIPLLDARNLRSQFVNGVDPFFGRQAGVRGTTMNHNLRFAHTFARSLDEPAGTQ